MLADPPELWSLGNTPFDRETAYAALLERGLGAEEDSELARAVHGAWALGSSEFMTDLAHRAGRPTAPRQPGRPRHEG